MGESVTLVVSGRPYTRLQKQDLKEYSYYFRALLSGNFSDSSKSTYKFQGWSTSAFEILLEYIKTGEIDIRGKTTAILENASEISQFLCMDDFKPKLVDCLIKSWPLLDTEGAFDLAEKFDVKKKLVDYALKKVMDMRESELQDNFLDIVNFDVLNLVTAKDAFWEIKTPGLTELEPFDVLWIKLLDRHKDMLYLALQAPPNRTKARKVVSRFKLEYFNKETRVKLLSDLITSAPSYACLKTALEDQLFSLRQNLRAVVSHIRIAFQMDYTKIKTLGVFEFDLNKWTWNVKEYDTKFNSAFCQMYKNYATFISESGLFIIRMNNRYPKQVKIKSEELLPLPLNEMKMYAAHGRYLFVFYSYNLVNEFLPVPLNNLLKIDLFTLETSECTAIPLENVRMRGHGDFIYMAGYNSNGDGELYVYTYNFKTYCTVLVTHSDLFGHPLIDVEVVKRKIYVFSRECYAVVDTKVPDQDLRLQVKQLAGLLCDIWDYELLETLPQSNCILLLLHVFAFGLYQSDFLVARVDIESNELTVLGIIPRITSVCDFNIHDYSKYYQMEARCTRRGKFEENQEIVQRIKVIDN